MIPDWLNTVHHDGSERYVSTLYPRAGERVHIRLRAGSTAPLGRVYLRTTPDGEQHFASMARVESRSRAESRAPVQWWEADLPINEPVVSYRFVLQAADGVWFYSAAGITDYEPPETLSFRIVADYNTPDWLADAVFYQIFPDSFANGDPTNDPQPHEYEYRGARPVTHPWGTPITITNPAAYSLNFYGGDLQGVRAHLDHLERLGVNAIYLNPVFTAYSNHRYDPIDYTHVDPHLGGDQALIVLRDALTARGMRYILDITPNHCGFMHPWFQQAQADPDSLEAAFFTFYQHPHDYLSWMGHKSLAKLNYTSAELRRRMYEADDAIFRRWLQPPFAADGWRIDVANMTGRQGMIQLNDTVARGIRRAVKETRPDAYLMGENFFEASAQLQGDQWDAVMNYAGLVSPLNHWLRGFEQGAFGLPEPIMSSVPFSTTALAASWRMRQAAIPWQIALQQYNLLDSHDTDRIRTVVGGSDALHRLAVVVQLTFPGVPAIYYGDEIGMENDPTVRGRGCMIWDEAQWNHSLFGFYQSLIALRRQSHALKRGGFQMLAIEADTFVYQRDSTEDHVIVVAHRGSTPRPAGPLPVAHGGIPDGARFVEHFSGQECTVQGGALHLPEQPQGASVWLREG